MKKKLKLILIILAVIFILIQFIPVNRSNPSSNANSEIAAPPEVISILKTSCYDCHSNKTIWPAYSYVAPMSFLISNHVLEGRKELNFSEWLSYPIEKQRKKLEEIQEEVSEDKMPMPVYLLLHGEAELTAEQKLVLQKWSSSASIIEAKK